MTKLSYEEYLGRQGNTPEELEVFVCNAKWMLAGHDIIIRWRQPRITAVAILCSEGLLSSSTETSSLGDSSRVEYRRCSTVIAKNYSTGQPVGVGIHYEGGSQGLGGPGKLEYLGGGRFRSPLVDVECASKWRRLWIRFIEKFG